jgi:hypothetical protein
MTMFNRGTWEIPTIPAKVIICEVKEAIMKVAGKSDAFIVPRK